MSELPVSDSFAHRRDWWVFYLPCPDCRNTFDTSKLSIMHWCVVRHLIYRRMLLLTSVFQPLHTYRGSPWRTDVSAPISRILAVSKKSASCGTLRKYCVFVLRHLPPSVGCDSKTGFAQDLVVSALALPLMADLMFTSALITVLHRSRVGVKK